MRMMCFAAAAIGLALAAPVPAFAATDAAAPQDFRAWLAQAVARAGGAPDTVSTLD